jgi:TIGR03009 family protein
LEGSSRQQDHRGSTMIEVTLCWERWTVNGRCRHWLCAMLLSGVSTVALDPWSLGSSALGQEAGRRGSTRNSTPRQESGGSASKAGQAQAGQAQAGDNQDGSASMEADAAMQAPFPPLTAEEQQRVDQLLGAWEAKTKQTERYRCEFKRWEYDNTKAQGGNAYRFSMGELRFEVPDSGLFDEKSVVVFNGIDEQNNPKFDPDLDAAFKWVCDGQATYEFDHRLKQVTRRALASNETGLALADSYIPFMFRLDAAQMKERFWIREMAQDPNQPVTDYALEVFPRQRDLAANYTNIQIVLDGETFLPEAIVLFFPTHNPQGGVDRREIFTFEKMKLNGDLNWVKQNILKQQFIEADVPRGYQVVDAAAVETPPMQQAKGTSDQR